MKRLAILLLLVALPVWGADRYLPWTIGGRWVGMESAGTSAPPVDIWETNSPYCVLAHPMNTSNEPLVDHGYFQTNFGYWASGVNHGTFVPASGPTNAYWNFDGGDYYIVSNRTYFSLGNGISNYPNGMTWMAWVRSDSGVYRTFMIKAATLDILEEWYIFRTSATAGRFRMQIFGMSNVTETLLYDHNTGVVPETDTNIWYHMAYMTYPVSEISNIWSVAILTNGAVCGTWRSYTNASPNMLLATNLPGNITVGAGVVSAFYGGMSDVRIYSYAMTNLAWITNIINATTNGHIPSRYIP